MPRAKKKATSKPHDPVKAHQDYIRLRHGNFENRVRNCLYARRKIAKKRRLEFTITVECFEEITHCPLLPDIKLRFDSERSDAHYSPSIDRLDPNGGYTPENTWIVSNRANRIKNDATLEELEAICRNWRAELERRGLI